MTHVLRGLRHRARLSPVLTAVTAIVGLGLALRSLVLGVTLSSPVPTFDGWAFVDDLVLLRAGRYGIADLFEQHNEHRIVTARISLFLDDALFHLGSLSVVVTDYLLFAILALVLAAVATRGRLLGVRLAAAALALAALWSAAGWINLVWSFQIQWAYVHLMPVLAVLAFVAARRDGPWRWLVFAAACVFDALAVYSMSSGLLAVVAVVAAAIWIRAPVRLVAAFVAVHAGLAVLFLHGYEAPPQPLVLAPAAILRYLAPYLGTAVPVSKTAAIRIGGVGLVLGAAAIAWATSTALVRRQPIDGPSAVLLGAVAFVFAEGLATAFGRAGLPNPTALALRYATPSELFWTALVLFAWRRLDRSGRRTSARIVAVLAVLAVAASNLVGHTAAAWRLWSVQADNEGFNLINGVETDARGQGIGTLPDEDQSRLDLMRTLQLGPFAESAAWFRAPLNSLSGTVPATLPACRGVLDQFTVTDGVVYHVQGWAVASAFPVSSIWAIAVTPMGRVLGYARTWQFRDDPQRLSGRGIALGYDFWFRRPAGEGDEPVDVVAVFPGHTAPPCRVPMSGRATAGTAAAPP